MFNNKFKKQLREQNWDKIQNNDSNPNQFWRRKRDEVNRAFEDIHLLLKILPYEKQREILTYQNIFPLIESISDSYRGNEKSFDLLIILDTVRHYLDFLTSIYSSKNDDSPNLSRLTIDYLERTRDICTDIVNITLNEQAHFEGSNREWTYIGKALNKGVIMDRKRFNEFVQQVLAGNKLAYSTGLVDDTTVTALILDHYCLRIKKVPMACSFHASIFNSYDSEHPGDPGSEIGKLYFDLNPLTKKAEIRILIGDIQINEELEVISKHRIHYFYASSKVTKKYKLNYSK